MFWVEPQPKLWTTCSDAREMMDHVSRWIDRRLLVLATLAVARKVEHLLRPNELRFFDVAERWVAGEITDDEARARATDIERESGCYRALRSMGVVDRTHAVAWEDEDEDAPLNIPSTQLYAMFVSHDPVYAIANPCSGSRDCVVYAAHALSPSARHPTTDFEEDDRPDWGHWSLEAIDRNGGVEGREFADNLSTLCDAIRDVIPYPRKGTLIARVPGAYVVRTKPGVLGLQQRPRPPESGRRNWWDGWIVGPEEELLECIPDPDLLRDTLRVLAPQGPRWAPVNMERPTTSSA